MKPRADNHRSLAALPLTLVLMLMLMLVACGSAPEPLEPDTAGGPPPGPIEMDREPPPTLPPAGQVSIEESPGGLRVLANQVPRIELLRALERALGFELELGQLAEETQAAPLTLIEIDASLAEVLLAALESVSFEVSYAVDATRGGHLVSLVRVAGGRGDGGEPARAERRAGRDRGERRARMDRDEHRERRAARREERPLSERAREAALRAEEAAQRIGSGNPEERRWAAENLGLDPDGIERLAELIASDPYPEVRAAAAWRLGDIDSNTSVQHLLAALHDPDPLVIREAIDALSFSDDESVALKMEFLLNHPDPDVQGDAEDAIDFLR